MRPLVGLAALTFSALYLVSDAVEAIQGGFSTGQLWLTLVAEAAIPVFVIGLYLVQRPRIGRLGLISAVAYAYAYVYFTGTVIYALANATSDYATLSDALQPWMTIHGAIMVFAGLGFGLAVLRANVLPRWTAVALMAGVVLGGVPIAGRPAPYDFTWAFTVLGDANGPTRLVVRERYAYRRPWAALIVEPVELISLMMSRRMLRGIANRAEARFSAQASAGTLSVTAMP